jgi:hypothetical protein
MIDLEDQYLSAKTPCTSRQAAQRGPMLVLWLGDFDIMEPPDGRQWPTWSQSG